MTTLQVTYLELCEIPASPADRIGSERIGAERMTRMNYLALYVRVGEPLRWDQRLLMPERELEALLEEGRLSIYVLRNVQGEALGFCEFDRGAFPEIELKNFGLVPEAQGRRLGPWLLSVALRDEWKSKPTRIWLHTDTWDHPAAIPVYQRLGFRVYAVRDEAPEGL
ncbi:MAG: GNAT family N-acetyltransferase [Pseudomonadota bacterium]|nr:GNAT family N-acetyltransferase [Pseudomonadota bacterium]